MIELTFLKVVMPIRQTHPKSLLFVTIFVFLVEGYKLQPSVCNY